MMLNKFNLITAALVAAIALPAQAANVINNAGFETGLTGWSPTAGFVDVVTFSDDVAYPSVFGTQFTATEGSQFAQLTAGDADVYNLLSQAFTLSSAARVSFDAAFLSFDELADNGDGTFSFNDDAYVRIFNASGTNVVFNFSIQALAGAPSTPWTNYRADLLAGDYVFEAGVRNADDPDARFSSKLLLDNVAVAVPEPGTWALMILGFGGTGAMIRARRRLVAAA